MVFDIKGIPIAHQEAEFTVLRRDAGGGWRASKTGNLATPREEKDSLESGLHGPLSYRLGRKATERQASQKLLADVLWHSHECSFACYRRLERGAVFFAPIAIGNR
jgi:hypothetical protein